MFYGRSKSLNLSFEAGGTWFVSLIIVGGHHQASKYHATLCLGSGSMAYKFPTDSANWWCQKLSVSRTVFTCSRQKPTQYKKEEDLIESTGVVLVKYSPNVKLENSHNSRVLKLGWIMRTLVCEGLEVFIVV